jgi:ABC-2 type transport system ATP-binding protein
MGIDPVEEPERVRALVGVLPQNAGLYEEFTVRENLQFIAEMQGVQASAIDDRIDEVVEILGIKDRLDTRVDHLSGGLKQRTMIARTLLGQPKLLFLDEPTTGLDVLVARKVRKTIKELSSKITIILATHNMFEAYQLCTKVAIIKEGMILMVDSPQNILKNHRKNDEDFEDVIARILGIDDIEGNEIEMEV